MMRWHACVVVVWGRGLDLLWCSIKGKPVCGVGPWCEEICGLCWTLDPDQCGKVRLGPSFLRGLHPIMWGNACVCMCCVCVDVLSPSVDKHTHCVYTAATVTSHQSPVTRLMLSPCSLPRSCHPQVCLSSLFASTNLVLSLIDSLN